MLMKAVTVGGGGGESVPNVVSGVLPKNTALDIEVEGTPQHIYMCDSRGYIVTNSNPSNGTVSDSQVWAYGAWSGSFTANTQLYFTRSNGRITMNRFWAQNDDVSYTIIYST